jgi:hypothetical protein
MGEGWVKIITTWADKENQPCIFKAGFHARGKLGHHGRVRIHLVLLREAPELDTC